MNFVSIANRLYSNVKTDQKVNVCAHSSSWTSACQSRPIQEWKDAAHIHTRTENDEEKEEAEAEESAEKEALSSPCSVVVRGASWDFLAANLRRVCVCLSSSHRVRWWPAILERSIFFPYWLHLNHERNLEAEFAVCDIMPSSLQPRENEGERENLLASRFHWGRRLRGCWNLLGLRPPLSFSSSCPYVRTSWPNGKRQENEKKGKEKKKKFERGMPSSSWAFNMPGMDTLWLGGGRGERHMILLQFLLLLFLFYSSMLLHTTHNRRNQRLAMVGWVGGWEGGGWNWYHINSSRAFFRGLWDREPSLLPSKLNSEWPKAPFPPPLIVRVWVGMDGWMCG